MSEPSTAAAIPSDVQLKWGIKIPLRDGVQLNATMYLPARHAEPAPALFTLTPYVAQSHHEQGVYFASQGYPFLAVDVRGRGNSQGIFRPSAHEAKDGHDVVEWLARQWYCNGKVAMWGQSYMGFAQWATAKEFPPSLVSIVPVASPFRGVDSPMRNNVFALYAMQWLTGVSGHTLQERIVADQAFWRGKFRTWFEQGGAFNTLDTFLGNPSPAFQEWVAHPQRDAFWDSFSPTADQYARISLPILTITGAYDGDQLGALEHYREHLKHATPEACSRHYLIIGPWDHPGTRSPQRHFGGLSVGPESLLDLPKLHRDWYAWTMQGAPKPAFLSKRVAYYVAGAERWRYADSLEEVTARYVPFYLQSSVNPIDVLDSGTLTPEGPNSQRPEDCYIYDPRDISLAELESAIDSESRVDQRMIYAAVGRQLVYHSAPFTTDTEISGFFRLSVWLSIDQPDTDFRVSVHEIGLDGSSIQLSTDWMRARFRESFREQRLVETTQPLQYDFTRFMFISRRIRAGHRLRLVIGPINSIYWQRNFNSGGIASEESIKDARAATVRLLHDAAYPSALYVPYGAVES